MLSSARPTSPTAVELYQTGLVSFSILVDLLFLLKANCMAFTAIEGIKKFVFTEGQGSPPQLAGSDVRSLTPIWLYRSST